MGSVSWWDTFVIWSQDRMSDSELKWGKWYKLCYLGLLRVIPSEAVQQVLSLTGVESLLRNALVGACCRQPSEVVLNCPYLLVSKRLRKIVWALWTVLTEECAATANGKPCQQESPPLWLGDETCPGIYHQQQLPPLGTKSSLVAARWQLLWEMVQGHLWEHVAWGNLAPLTVPSLSHICEDRVCWSFRKILTENNKFPNEKLAGLEAPKPEVCGSLWQIISVLSGFLGLGAPGEDGVCAIICHLHWTSGHPLFIGSHLKLWASSTTLPRDLFPLELVLSFWYPSPLTSIFEV